MLGSFLFDAVIHKEKYPNLVEKIIKVIDKSNQDRKKIFDEVNTNYFDRINYKPPKNI